MKFWLGLLFLASVSSVSHATEYNSGIVWFEIPVQSLERAQNFYKSLFGWNFSEVKKAPGNARQVLILKGDNKVEVGELVEMKKFKKGFGTGIYFPVTDIKASYDYAINKLGASSVYAPMAIPEETTGSIAMVRDLDGNRIGLFSEKPLR